MKNKKDKTNKTTQLFVLDTYVLYDPLKESYYFADPIPFTWNLFKKGDHVRVTIEKIG